MKALKFLPLLLLTVCLSACAGGESSELPSPNELYAEIQSRVELPEMANVADYMLEANTGITPDDYTEAVYYVLSEGISPDEIIVIRAKDTAAADVIAEKLNAWLTYREEAARVYLTEYMPIIQQGVVRQDGLTVSLLVSPSIDEILQVFDSFQ